MTPFPEKNSRLAYILISTGDIFNYRRLLMSVMFICYSHSCTLFTNLLLHILQYKRYYRCTRYIPYIPNTFSCCFDIVVFIGSKHHAIALPCCIHRLFILVPDTLLLIFTLSHCAEKIILNWAAHAHPLQLPTT